MGDPYWRYGASAETGGLPRTSFPGYLSSEPSTLTSHHLWPSNDIRGIGSVAGIYPETGLGGLTAGGNIKSYPSPLQDSYLLGQRRDVAADLINERPGSLRNLDGIPVPTKESNILFVEGLPNDCSRREVGHLFRPFIGFKEIRVVHKEPRRSGDKAMVLCFVEFNDAKCALTALEALQGYKFDDKKPDSPALKIQFAHFPFRLPSEHDEQRFGGPR